MLVKHAPPAPFNCLCSNRSPHLIMYSPRSPRRPEIGSSKRVNLSASGASCTRCWIRPTSSSRCHPLLLAALTTRTCSPLSYPLPDSKHSCPYHSPVGRGSMLNQHPRDLCSGAPAPSWGTPVGAHSGRNTADRPAARSQAGVPLRGVSKPLTGRGPRLPRPASDADSIALGSPVGAVTLWVLPSKGHLHSVA